MATAQPPDSRELPSDPDSPSVFHLRTQRVVDDELIAAGLFMPNAVGRGELSTLTGLSQRQAMKCRRRYLGERVLVGLTCLHLYLVPPMVGWPVVGPRYLDDIVRIDRADVRATEVPVAVPGLGRAVRIVDRRRATDVVELRMRVIDAGARRVLRLLLADHR